MRIHFKLLLILFVFLISFEPGSQAKESNNKLRNVMNIIRLAETGSRNRIALKENAKDKLKRGHSKDEIDFLFSHDFDDFDDFDEFFD
jgi:hypothetical protein